MADEIHTDPITGQEQDPGNQENPNGEVIDPPEGEQPGEQLTPEQLRANVTRANQQAAAERVKRQEALTELEDIRAKISEMKSVEEVDALIAGYQGKLSASEEKTNRLQAAQDAGLPAGWETRLTGSTYEEMLEDAKSLAPQIVVQKTPPVPLPPGGGRTPNPTGDDEPGAGWKAAKRKSQ